MSQCASATPHSFSHFFFNKPTTTEIYTLSLHDALPILCAVRSRAGARRGELRLGYRWRPRSEEHTSELQSHSDIVCRLLLEKKKKIITPSEFLSVLAPHLIRSVTVHGLS